MNRYFFTKQMKNGMFRLYKLQALAIISWRGSNDKITLVRDENNQIVQNRNRQVLVDYCKQKFNCIPFEDQ